MAGLIVVVMMLILAVTNRSMAQGSVFTYQGRLTSGGNSANGNFDLIFLVSTNENGAGQIGGTVTNLDVAVSNGFFTVALDFGAGIFTGENCWLEVGVRTNGSNAGFTLLSPLQPVTATPYAITAANFSGTLSPGQLAGNYSSMVTLSNPSNQITGAFNGNGAGLTNLSFASSVGLMPIEAFGAQGGSNDDTAAFQAAAYAGKPVLLSNPNGYTTRTFYVTNNTCLIGLNARVRFMTVANSTNVTGNMIDSTGTETNVVLDGLILDGQNAGFDSDGPWEYGPGFLSVAQRATSIQRSGVHLSVFCTNSVVRNCAAMGFSDCGFRFYGTGGLQQPLWQSTRFIDCAATYCWEGANFTNGAEYVPVANFSSINCGEGMEIDSGNVFVNGGQDVKDGIGIAVFNGGNPAHSTISSRTINHCYLAASFQGLGHGEQMIGCQMEGAEGITISNCTAVVIQNCVFSPGGAYESASGYDILVDGAGGNAGMNYFLNNGMTGPSFPVIGTPNGGLILTNGSYNANNGVPLPYYNGWNNIFTGSNTFANVSGNGAGITNLPASAIYGGATTNIVIGGVTLVFTNGVLAGAR